MLRLNLWPRPRKARSSGIDGGSTCNRSHSLSNSLPHPRSGRAAEEAQAEMQKVQPTNVSVGSLGLLANGVLFAQQGRREFKFTFDDGEEVLTVIIAVVETTASGWFLSTSTEHGLVIEARVSPSVRNIAMAAPTPIGTYGGKTLQAVLVLQPFFTDQSSYALSYNFFVGE